MSRPHGAVSDTRGTGRERGAAAVEFALLLPLFVLLVSVVVGGARVWLARATLEQASAAAARTASLARTPAAAVSGAKAAAASQATTAGLRCSGLGVEVDADGLAASAGKPARAVVTVSCVVPLGDVLVPGWPGELALSATSFSVIDSYRGRS